MTSPGLPAFPDAALTWLVPRPLGQARALVLGRSGAPVIEQLAGSGAALVACDASRGGLRALVHRAPGALPTVARPERLPFAAHAFDAVFVHQSLQHLQADAVLPELARVLTPGGRLALSWMIRDDSVPWVRRLAALLQDVDPEAMTGNYGTDSVAALADVPWFPTVERRNHRLWVPIARVDLMQMVAHRFPDLPADRLAQLMREVGELYESSARPPEPLLLPYQVACWRAEVNHSALPNDSITPPDDGLAIRL
ncbi:class I SAM-dependent methyltransferase [Propioniciclava soli]|uniref:class I SAM-dependent methyltransferase n=1 Tax=Propioniciclava soli TaxID=2775081 RepID=UPI001E3AF089|nr:class I SAM-dependent methyltransferase [Propioniciclava soli]